MTQVQIGDLSMYYEVKGTGDPVLLIHGLGGDHRGWEFQEEHLSEHFRVIIPDLRGHGQTTVRETDGIAPPSQFADDLAGLLDHLGHDRVHVIGHSLGGFVAQHFVLNHPKRVSKLVLVDTSPRVTEEMVDVVFSWREAQIEGGQEAYFWTGLRSSYSDEWIENNPEMVAHLKARSEVVNEEGIVSAGVSMSTSDMTEQLKKIEAETLIIHGDQDRVISIEMGKLLYSKIPNSKMKILVGCGHSPTVERTEEFNETLIEFLAR